jgi:hypothetical protein
MDFADNVEHAVSYTDSVASGLRRYSTVLGREAAAILSMTEHRPGQERSEIGVVHRGHSGSHESTADVDTYLDSIVYLQAPDEAEKDAREGKVTKGPDGKGGKQTNAWRAVQAIEFGHYTRPREHDGEGPRTRADHRRSWVAGVSPLRKAARKMSRNPRLSIR